MQRYFVAEHAVIENEQKIFISGDDYHHIKNVMRAQIGDSIICTKGLGNDYYCEIMAINQDDIETQIIEKTPSQGEPLTKVTIAQSLPKGDKLEWILQKCTELGATTFIPFTSKRTIVKIDERKQAKKHDRWMRIVKEAAEQAHRGLIPTVTTPYTWDQLLSEMDQYDEVWICYEKGGESLVTSVKNVSGNHILLIVGPEGGFVVEEIEAAREAGAIPISLGTRILRTETASIMALSCILFGRNDLGGEVHE
ncbi:16S rRNA (uracil(1498)-N(3))-methyltransferase [Hazenella sp. IB182357]|uniref:Ribosomal RNA small subunit methyltransferase E n=1 Tax=Polycladospora coralii TaxID=2771432 RepID=A0A926RSG2_9BACL|nr:16S rRNA (uracil(1498)-N(3))-methyltransferase [Polycladospora coralii]MBD1371145.1 16S rRNA (uracil(1498)-N(3))-methyltransferase [Polycladospora coralii]MBS7530087.1 16S rRNA (uracil(1498)-N(3))-methyltransferase [Polycladospora coralii]